MREQRRLLIYGAIVIVCWQGLLLYGVENYSRDYRLKAMGLCNDYKFFLSPYVRDGVFPVARRVMPDGTSVLVNDLNSPCTTARLGDYGKIWLLLPEALWRGPDAATARWPTRTLFLASLLATWAAFCAVRRPVMGGIIVLLVGSDPFQLFEAYSNNNIFSLPITVALAALATHARLLAANPPPLRRLWIWPIAAGAVLATVREIRLEPALIGLSLIAVYLTIKGLPLTKRATLAGVLIVTFYVTSAAWGIYWDAKFAQARRFVADHGGHPLPSAPMRHHNIWHTLLCGLGDYDHKYGHVWSDDPTYASVMTTVMREDPSVRYSGGRFLEAFHDPEHLYPIHVCELPAYGAAARHNFLGAIRGDPRWYARILGRRLIRIMNETTPLSIELGIMRLSFPLPGWIVLVALAAALAARDGFAIKVILFTAPLSLTALCMYSGIGNTYYAIFHLIAIAVLIELAVRFIKDKRLQSIKPPPNAQVTNPPPLTAA